MILIVYSCQEVVLGAIYNFKRGQKIIRPADKKLMKLPQVRAIIFSYPSSLLFVRVASSLNIWQRTLIVFD